MQSNVTYRNHKFPIKLYKLMTLQWVTNAAELNVDLN